MSTRKIRIRRERRGTTVVETAVVLPVFLLMVFVILEFGHAFMVTQVLQAAARRGARLGVTTGATSEDVVQKVKDILSGTISTDDVTVIVKNADVFDTSGSAPGDIALLPDVEVADMEPRQLFLVRVEVPYDNVRVINLEFLAGIVLKGQAVMRHE
jgi:Flp pilus assembly protein TadG